MAGKKQNAPAPAEVSQTRKAAGEDEFADTITSPFSQWWDYIRSNFKRCFLQLLKINIVDILLAAALMISGVIAFYALGASLTAMADNGAPFEAASILLTLLVFAAYFWLRETVKSTMLVFMHSEFAKKPFGIWPALKFALFRMAKYFALNNALFILIAVPAVLLVCLPSIASLYGGVEGGALIALALLSWAVAGGYALLACSLYILTTQFWKYGFLAQGLGVWKALKESVRLVRKSPIQVLIAGAGGLLISMLPLSFFFGAYLLIYAVTATLALAAAYLAPAATMAVFLAGLLLIYAALVVFWTLAECVWMPVHYLLWRRISAGKQLKEGH